MNKDLIQELAHQSVVSRDVLYTNSDGKAIVVDKELHVDLVKFASLIVQETSSTLESEILGLRGKLEQSEQKIVSLKKQITNLVNFSDLLNPEI
jgi:hypothetical protein